ncbi:MAG: DUF4405 domain-containing protein [Nitrospinales bacterium]
MKRSELNFIVDAIALVGVVALTSTGLMIRFILPPFQGGRGKYTSPMMLWGLDRHQWGEIHFWISIGLMAVLVFHLFLHWRWIISVVCNKSSEGSGIRAVLGLSSFIALLIVAASPFFVSVEEAPRHRMERGKGHMPKLKPKPTLSVQQETPNALDRDLQRKDENLPDKRPAPEEKEEEHKNSQGHSSLEIDIRGNMTLQEVENAFGVPVSVILEKLSLPPDTAPHERLGRLQRQFGFKMSQARKVAKENLEKKQTGLSSEK